MEKLPSISKNVWWRPVVPTTSMSTVRKHFWQLVNRWWGGFSWPRKYGLSGLHPRRREQHGRVVARRHERARPQALVLALLEEAEKGLAQLV